MKILLLHSSLHFMWIGAGKIHALDNRYTNLICGRGVPSDVVPHIRRQLDTSQICGQCLASLRTYTSDKVRFEREAAS